jgi:hypothetical protein
MLFRKLFQLLVLGGAVIGVSGCATTNTTSDASGAKTPPPSSPPPPPASMGSGVQGW